jgi:hypothetical protein
MGLDHNWSTTMATKQNGRFEDGMADVARAQAALVQAQATLVQNEAALVPQTQETNKRMAEVERGNAERFARIESLLIENNRILLTLPDALCKMIGFKAG